MARKRSTERREFTIDFSALKNQWLAYVDGRLTPESPWLAQAVQDWKTARPGGWSGGNAKQVAEWCRDGYSAGELAGDFGEYHETRDRRRLVFGETGELHADLAMSGFDYPFQEWTPRRRKPGLAVHIEFTFAASTPAKVVEEYGRWIAQMVQRFETSGFDLEVSLSIPGIGTYQDDRTRKDVTHIRLKRENEASDFSDWSAMFSPGGFRVLGFTALALGGVFHKTEVCSSLGMPDGKGQWNIEWSPETRLLNVRCPNHSDSFPADKLTKQLETVGV